MLANLHVKNFALIDEVFVEFSDGLNVLTGETGAGKSIILGSLNLAFGGKADKDSIREGCDFALVEITFKIDNENDLEALKNLDIYPEEGEVLIQRKILPQKSVFKINGETVNASMVKEVTNILIDVYGQHDYQYLLKPQKHIEIIDAFGEKEISGLVKDYKNTYSDYLEIKKLIEAPNIDEAAREREMSLLKYQIGEIEAANLKAGEEEELETLLRVMENIEKIEASLSFVNNVLCNNNESAENCIDAALREMNSVSSFDDKLSEITDMLNNASDYLSQCTRSISDYLDNTELDPNELQNIRSRYEIINDLERKYGRTVEEVLKFAEAKRNELDNLVNLAQKKEQLLSDYENTIKKLNGKSDIIHMARVKNSELFEKELIKNLSDLNFNQCEFKVEIEESEEFLSNGKDKVSFLISTNPGESLKAVNNVASGGELSRIMLAIKTANAFESGNETYIFDEIDSGISGVTAWKVAEKLAVLSRKHQVILITHLQQIASMADTHFEIKKTVQNNDRTRTVINRLDEEGQLAEIVRMLGGDTQSDAFLGNAVELKNRAQMFKNNVN